MPKSVRPVASIWAFLNAALFLKSRPRTLVGQTDHNRRQLAKIQTSQEIWRGRLAMHRLCLQDRAIKQVSKSRLTGRQELPHMSKVFAGPPEIPADF
ncbi:hypothetical protein METBIDRAFT_32594 [Metschnikowia bicuspidata var. bicuspidata NRRL YB-4993]|uniref:Uncharacterized protein n=1 Tax=Metschnikowia bicuspidata var. bicuspidata NRRL YB-4993 TaxID=869754 RepID=A0A1A0H9C5_9ASCO|nr:hypothetical protein METBIDRAFT_32594 [Metschnikowia bicuspidata var. bicuspidata NRRL YB-4993]OBA20621.1 hypothetical protein METBIDRAFT_32594 [Metschnikowia bicuspidata var. bicuspidata NRRL YB-4993]